MARILTRRTSSRAIVRLAVKPNPLIAPGASTLRSSSFCLLFEEGSRVFYPPVSLDTTALAAIFCTVEIEEGRRINAIHVAPTSDANATATMLIDQHGWPDNTKMKTYVNVSAKTWAPVDV